MSSKEGQGTGGRETSKQTLSIFLGGDKVSRKHINNPDTILSPFTRLHRSAGSHSGAPQRNHLLPQPAVGSETTLNQ